MPFLDECAISKLLSVTTPWILSLEEKVSIIILGKVHLIHSFCSGRIIDWNRVNGNEMSHNGCQHVSLQCVMALPL